MFFLNVVVAKQILVALHCFPRVVSFCVFILQEVVNNNVHHVGSYRPDQQKTNNNKKNIRVIFLGNNRVFLTFSRILRFFFALGNRPKNIFCAFYQEKTLQKLNAFF